MSAHGSPPLPVALYDILVLCIKAALIYDDNCPRVVVTTISTDKLISDHGTFGVRQRSGGKRGGREFLRRSFGRACAVRSYSDNGIVR